MSNIFLKSKHKDFTWQKLGDIAIGRQVLGDQVPVQIYRALQYSLNDVLNKELGNEKADAIFVKAGYITGCEFAKNLLDLTVDFNTFVANLQKKLIDLRIGILRIETFDLKAGTFTLTIAEDLDCSGLPVSDEVVCNYDEGFLAGIVEQYTGKVYEVKEIDCWASGDRVCRFKGTVVQ